MAATCNITEDQTPLSNSGEPILNTKIRYVTWDWTSHTDGTVTGVGETTKKHTGFLMAVETDPDGSAAPTDDYDIVILNEQGSDVLCGAGADRDTANNEIVYPTPNSTPNPVPLYGTTLELQVANAGSGKSGRVIACILIR